MYGPDMWEEIGITPQQRVTKLWVEGVDVNSVKGNAKLEFKVDPSGTANGTQFALVDTVRFTVVDVDVLIGADHVSDESLHDDWVGYDPTPNTANGHRIYNLIRLIGPANLEQTFLIDRMQGAGGTIELLEWRPVIGSDPLTFDWQAVSQVTDTLNTGGVSTDVGEFLIRGKNASGATEDVAVRARFNNQVFGRETLTVVKFNPEPETGSASSPIPVNPAIVTSSAPAHRGNLFAVDVGRPGFPETNQHGEPIPDFHMTSEGEGGSIVPILSTSRKIAPNLIEVSWGRVVNPAGGGATPTTYTTSNTAGSGLIVNPPDNAIAGNQSSNLRMRDTGLTGAIDAAAVQIRYVLAHPSEKVIPASSAPSNLLTGQTNFAAAIDARSAPALTFPIAVHVMQLINPANGAVIGDLAIAPPDVDAMVADLNTIYTQAGVTFTLNVGNRFEPQQVTETNVFDVDDSRFEPFDYSTDNVTQTNNRPNVIDIYLVRRIGEWSGDGRYAGVTIVQEVDVAGNSAGILVARQLTGTAGNLPVDQMARTVGHEMGHYLMRLGDNGAHRNEVWNLMSVDNSTKLDLENTSNADSSQVNLIRAMPALVD